MNSLVVSAIRGIGRGRALLVSKLTELTGCPGQGFLTRSGRGVAGVVYPCGDGPFETLAPT